MFIYIYLFISGFAGSSLLQGLFSACGVRASLAVKQRPWNTGSAAVVQGLSCSVECEIFPDKRSKPSLLHWQADSLPLSHQGSPQLSFE